MAKTKAHDLQTLLHLFTCMKNCRSCWHFVWKWWIGCCCYVRWKGPQIVKFINKGRGDTLCLAFSCPKTWQTFCQDWRFNKWFIPIFLQKNNIIWFNVFFGSLVKDYCWKSCTFDPRGWQHFFLQSRKRFRSNIWLV